MPKILEQRVQALLRRGMPKDKAWPIATAALQKEGKLEKKNK